MADAAWSFGDVTGSVTSTGGSGSIGSGSGIDDAGISIRYDEQASVKRGSDKAMTVLRPIKSGTITVEVLANSPLNLTFAAIAAATIGSGTGAAVGQDSLNVSNTVTGESHNIQGATLQSQGEWGYNAEGAARRWTWVFTNGSPS